MLITKSQDPKGLTNKKDCDAHD